MSWVGCVGCEGCRPGWMVCATAVLFIPGLLACTSQLRFATDLPGLTLLRHSRVAALRRARMPVAGSVAKLIVVAERSVKTLDSAPCSINRRYR